MGGKAGRIWVREKPGGEPEGVAEASHLGLGRVGAASPWRQRLEAPLELLTEARVHMCVHPGPRAHTHSPQSPRNHGSSQKPLNKRRHMLEGTRAMESVSGARRETGIQEDQQGPCSLRPRRAEAQSSTPINHPSGVSYGPVLD